MKHSGGLLVYRKIKNKFEVLLGHYGGPFWQNKDKNSWTIPKGEIEKDETIFEVAIREFEEETGLNIDDKEKSKIFYLTKVKSKYKILTVYFFKKNFGNNLKAKSNLVTIEYPLGSGKFIKIPEIDKIAYFDLENAKDKLISYQKVIIDIFIKKIFSF